jgi:lysozyme
MKPRKDILVAIGFLLVSVLLGLAIWWAWHHYISTPPYVDNMQFPVKGLDVSAHNGMMNLDAAAEEGYSFVWIKASEGSTFHDENFSLNVKKARHAGMRTGAYHYFRFDKDGVSQAVNLLRAVKGHRLDMGLAVDVEDAGNARGVPQDSIIFRLQQMQDFLNLCGYRVTFYSNRDGYEKYLLENFRGFPLWICSFSRENALNDDWTFWQYDHHGKVAGIIGDVDLNVFNGSLEDWEALFLK